MCSLEACDTTLSISYIKISLLNSEKFVSKELIPEEMVPCSYNNVTVKGTSVIVFFQICITVHRKTACMSHMFHYYNTNTVQSRKVAAEINIVGCMHIPP